MADEESEGESRDDEKTPIGRLLNLVILVL
jgi:hypothetical protein